MVCLFYIDGIRSESVDLSPWSIIIIVYPHYGAGMFSIIQNCHGCNLLKFANELQPNILFKKNIHDTLLYETS